MTEQKSGVIKLASWKQKEIVIYSLYFSSSIDCRVCGRVSQRWGVGRVGKKVNWKIMLLKRGKCKMRSFSVNFYLWVAAACSHSFADANKNTWSVRSTYEHLSFSFKPPKQTLIILSMLLTMISHFMLGR